MRFALSSLLVSLLVGCATAPAKTWKGTVEWPDDESAKLVGQPLEAGAVLAAAGAIREVIRTSFEPRLFRGCSSPEQALVAVVFTGPTAGLYYVVVHHDFIRCGGPRYRLLDGWVAYAVTPQGEVVAQAPPPAADPSFFAPPSREPAPLATPPPAP